MPIQVAIGFSQDKNPEVAAKNAAFEAKSNLGADRIDAAIIFSTVHYNPERTIPILQRVLNNAPMLGTSTSATHEFNIAFGYLQTALDSLENRTHCKQVKLPKPR